MCVCVCVPPHLVKRREATHGFVVILSEKRVPVVPHVELGVGRSGVPFVDADELAVPWVSLKKAPSARLTLKDNVI